MPKASMSDAEIARALHTWANSNLPLAVFVGRQEDFQEALKLEGKKFAAGSLRTWLYAALKDKDKYPVPDWKALQEAHDRYRNYTTQEKAAAVKAWFDSGSSFGEFAKECNAQNPPRKYNTSTLSVWVGVVLKDPSLLPDVDREELQAAQHRAYCHNQREKTDAINAWTASGRDQAGFVRQHNTEDPTKSYTVQNLNIWVEEALRNPSLLPDVDQAKLHAALQEGLYLPEIAAAKIYGDYWQLRQDWPHLPRGVRIAIRPETADRSPELAAIVVTLNPSGLVEGWPGTSQPPEFLADPGLDLDDPHVIAALKRAGVNDAMYKEAWYTHRDFRHANSDPDPQGTGNLLTTGAATAHLPGPYPHHSHHQQQGAPSATRPAGGHTSAAGQRNVAK